MKITRKQAVALFQALGFQTANKWETARLETKIKNLPEILEDGYKKLGGKNQELLNTILKKLKNGKNILITREEQPKEKEEVKQKPEEKKEIKQLKTKGKDKFGCRLGTNLAKINAALTSTPQSMESLVKEAKLSDTYHNHFKKLINKKLIKITKDKKYYI